MHFMLANSHRRVPDPTNHSKKTLKLWHGHRPHLPSRKQNERQPTVQKANGRIVDVTEMNPTRFSINCVMKLSDIEKPQLSKSR